MLKYYKTTKMPLRGAQRRGNLSGRPIMLITQAK